MLEVVVALLVFGSIGSAILFGVSTVQTSGSKTEVQSVAENLARNQMEYLYSLAYQGSTSTYPSITALPPGYGVTAESRTFIEGDSNIEKIVVTVSRGGRDILVLESLRTKD